MPVPLMHPKFAARLAKVISAKRKAHGPEAVSRWWEDRFGHIPDPMFRQVMAELKKTK